MGLKPHMVLITHSFPFGNAERTFLASEMETLVKYFKVDIVSRNISDSITTKLPTDCCVYRYDTHKDYNWISLLLNTFFSSDFWKEVIYLVKNNKDFLHCIRQTVSIHMRMLHFSRFLTNIRRDDGPTVYYTYWNGYETYACKKIRSEKDILITRTHGGDLYLKSDNRYYQPYKDIANEGINRVYFISDNGKDYYNNTYLRLSSSQTKVARLGTINHNIESDISTDGYVHIISLSRLFWVKRIDKLIESLSVIDDIRIDWTHIGDGELHDEIFSMAHDFLGHKSNISYHLLGNLDNSEVFSFMQSHPVDLIVNTSYSEGLPVSLMEAMSCGIPALAVAVGGIPEIIDDGVNGFLIPRDFTVDDFKSKIIQYADFSIERKQEMHNNAFQMWEKNYNASVNYADFARNIMGLLE